MQIALLTNPASGQANVQLATAQELVRDGHHVTFITGASFAKKVHRLRMQQPTEKAQQLISFVSLGSGQAMEDFTTRIQHGIHDGTLRKPPGDPKSMQTCIEVAAVTAQEHGDAALIVRDAIERLDPDMIVTDVLSPTLLTGTRLTGRKWLMTVPCSPGLTGIASAWDPHPMAANRSGSWGTFFENLYLNVSDFLYHSRTPAMSEKRTLLSKRFGLKSFGLAKDTALLPPLWEDPNCLGGIHFNVFGLTDCPKQPSNFVFVGAGISPEPSRAIDAPPCDLLLWMDEALAWEEDVVYINMGSMFIWQEEEFWSVIQALQTVYMLRAGKVRFIFKLNRPLEVERGFKIDTLPPYIRLVSWIESQQSVYQHDALKVFVHHGGGNSFNEAVYYGVPQLVLSQWLDTHELGALAERFGIGLRSARPPKIDKNDVQEKLLNLLGAGRHAFQSQATTWSLRSQLGGGAPAAAKIVECHAQTFSPHRLQAELLKSEKISSPIL